MEKVNYENILGVRFDSVTLNEAVERALAWVDRGNQSDKSYTQHLIVTPNPEMLLAAQNDSHFKDVLNSADLSLPDGTGVVWASRLNGWRNKHVPIILERVTGIDFMKAFVGRLAPHKTPIFLLGAKPGVAEAACHELKKQHRDVQIVGTFSGSPRDRDFEDIKHKLDRTKPSVLFVAFGAPAQELWIAKHLKELPYIKIAVGVGGAFDFIAGEKKTRAPLDAALRHRVAF